LPQINRVHFIGIGGSGMSGIALVAHERGIKVTGSDLKQSRYMRSLLRSGVPVTVGHNVSNVEDPSIDVVVVSTAIPENNPELKAAKARGLEIWQRARMLAYLGEGKKTLAVAGTHGKTTTSAMLATTLDRLGADPSFLIGGVVDGYDSTAKAGRGEFFVVEADESDGSFVWLDPTLAIVTNIEADHLDHFADLDEIIGIFESFLNKLVNGGTLFMWDDAPQLTELTNSNRFSARVYGCKHNSPLRCEPKSIRDFDVVFEDGARVSLSLPSSPGLHNMLNATAVMGALDTLGFDRETAALALSQYSGVRRRFDCIGEQMEITLVDDYAHHPTEIAATLKAASELEYRRVHVLFQPHRYSRTQALLSDFAHCFDYADTITFMDVYSAGETPIPGVNGEAMLEAVLAHNPEANVRFIRHRTDVPEVMAGVAKAGDLIITMGAGDVTTLGPLILDSIKQRDQLDEKL